MKINKTYFLCFRFIIFANTSDNLMSPQLAANFCTAAKHKHTHICTVISSSFAVAKLFTTATSSATI